MQPSLPRDKHRSMRLMNKLFLAALMLGLLTACDAKPKMLGITGYNYTNRYIDTFSVDGRGGAMYC